MRTLAIAVIGLASLGCRVGLAAGDPELFVPRQEVHELGARESQAGEVWLEPHTAAPGMKPDQLIEADSATLPLSQRAPVEVQVWVPNEKLPFKMRQR